MSKVKIVQISACYDNEGNSGNEYLDDKGRVWYQDGRWEQGEPNGYADPSNRKWVLEWHQLELPDEPAPKAPKGTADGDKK